MMFFCIKSDLSKRIKRIDKCVGCDAKVRTRQRCARARGWAELSCQSCPRAPASAHQLHAHTHAAGGNSSSCVCVHCFSTRVRASGSLNERVFEHQTPDVNQGFRERETARAFNARLPRVNHHATHVGSPAAGNFKRKLSRQFDPGAAGSAAAAAGGR